MVLLFVLSWAGAGCGLELLLMDMGNLFCRATRMIINALIITLTVQRGYLASVQSPGN